jgi:hypothetical protein
MRPYEHGGQLKVKIHILFYGDNSWTVALSQKKFGTIEDHDKPTRFIWFIILFDRAFKYADGENFGVMWGQMLNHSVEYCNFVQCLHL